MQPKVESGFGLPEGNDGWSDWTWFHARASAPSRFTILCEAPVNYAGHFSKGRMVPCAGQDCPLCAKGLGVQARYVFSVVEWQTRRVGLLELGRGHALQIQDWIPTNGGLRGLTVEIMRSSHSKQSRVDMTLISDSTPLFFQHLEGPDLARAVKSTWQRAASQSLHDSLPGESCQREKPGQVRRDERVSA
jgi:hypothetical protein